MYIENIVIGKPIATPESIFALDEVDWEQNEKEKTYFTEERYLPRILVDLGFYSSISEVRKNKPNLVVNLDKIDFIHELKIKKKQWIWILVGE